jgi:hypothetical protein
MRFHPLSSKLPVLIAALFATILSNASQAAPLWNASVGAEADDAGANTADVDIGWSPTDRFGLSFAAGHATGPDDLGGDFSSTTVFAGMDWRFARLAGVALGYDSWNDSGVYEKRTAHATFYVGNDRARFGLLAQSIESETTAEMLVLRRKTSLTFDGSGYGAELLVSGDRMSVWASYVVYSYDENVDRLITFLDNPNLARRPRLETLLGSGLTAAATLLDRSAVAGADFYVRDLRLGVSYSLLTDIVTDSDLSSLRGEVEWPLTDRWSARLVAGVNDSDIESSTLFGGARLLYRSQ